MAWNVRENEPFLEKFLLHWFGGSLLNNQKILLKWQNTYKDICILALKENSVFFFFLYENLDLGKYTVIKLSCYLLFAVMLNVIKVNQICLNYFVEKNVPIVSFYSFRFSGCYFPSRLHTLNCRGEFTHLTIDMCAIWDVSAFPWHMQRLGKYDTVRRNNLTLLKIIAYLYISATDSYAECLLISKSFW